MVSGAAVSKPFGGVRSFLAVRLGLAVIEGGELSLGGGGVLREVWFLGQSCRNRSAEFARSSLSALDLPTPIVALAYIGNVDIQVFSSVNG